MNLIFSYCKFHKTTLTFLGAEEPRSLILIGTEAQLLWSFSPAGGTFDDCDDNNPTVNPGTLEVVYNGIDDDCAIATPDDDLDGDGFSLIDDCNDLDSLINPAAEEIPNNGIDEDCDGLDLLNSTYDLNNITISIFPNPTTGIVNIKKDGYLKFRVSLFDTYGQLLISKINVNKLNLENYTEGTYILTLFDLDSKNYIVERIALTK